MPESRPDSCEKQAYLSSYSSAEKIPWAWVDTDGWREGEGRCSQVEVEIRQRCDGGEKERVRSERRE